MSWKEDRDALIAQTMAFVQSVTGRKAERDRPDIVEPTALPVFEALDAQPSPTVTPPVAPVNAMEPSSSVFGAAASGAAPPPIVPGEMASEIRARIAGFRAHQERFNREREEYFSKTLARLKATLNEMPPPRRPEK